MDPLPPRRLALALACALALLAGCSNHELYSQLSERQANEMIAVLRSAGIDAEKQSREGTFSVLTAASDFPQAVRALSAQGYPREQFDSMGKVFKREGFVSTPLEERARLITRCRRRSPTPSPASTAWSRRASTWWCPSAIRSRQAQAGGRLGVHQAPPRQGLRAAGGADQGAGGQQHRRPAVRPRDGRALPGRGPAAAADAARRPRASRSTSACWRARPPAACSPAAERCCGGAAGVGRPMARPPCLRCRGRGRPPPKCRAPSRTKNCRPRCAARRGNANDRRPAA